MISAAKSRPPSFLLFSRRNWMATIRRTEITIVVARNGQRKVIGRQDFALFRPDKADGIAMTTKGDRRSTQPSPGDRIKNGGEAKRYGNLRYGTCWTFAHLKSGPHVEKRTAGTCSWYNRTRRSTFLERPIGASLVVFYS